MFLRSCPIFMVLSLLGCGSAQAPAPPAGDPAISANPEAEQTVGQEAPAELLQGAREPRPYLVTGGKPTADDLREIQAAGFRTIISLLPPEQDPDEASMVEELGMRFVSIPVASPDDLTEENARRLAAVLAEEPARPMVLHCASGNRAGALLALAAFYGEGLSPQEALELGLAAGLTSLRPAVESRLGL